MPADLLVDRDQFQAQFLKTMVLVDFRLRFAPCGGGRKRLGDGFAANFAGQANLGIVTRVVGLGAMAGRFSAAARDGTDRPGAQIAKASELEKDFAAFGFQLLERIRHRAASFF
jgi:hypothetical protein